MYGIFGHVGPRASARLLVEGLKRLEYRGYDSWDMSLARESEAQAAHGVGRITAADVSELDPLAPILAVIPLQLLAYHIAAERGCNVDRPRNPPKSVTVE